MTYRLYAEEWHLTHTVTTGIFAIYPIVVVAALIDFGDISDHVGWRATMLLGLCASLIGAFLFAVAPDVLWLFAGRALMGVGVSLTAGPSTAAMVEFSAEGQSWRAASITAAAQAFGFAAASGVAPPLWTVDGLGRLSGGFGFWGKLPLIVDGRFVSDR